VKQVLQQIEGLRAFFFFFFFFFFFVTLGLESDTKVYEP
jgi:hypothetical protein